jgi:hypothetical protein
VVVVNWYLQVAAQRVKSVEFMPFRPHYFHSQPCKTIEVFLICLLIVEPIYAKNAIKSNFYLECWLLSYSQNCSGGGELVPSSCSTTRKKCRFHAIQPKLFSQPTMQNNESFSHMFVHSRTYLCEKSYEIQFLFGGLVVDLFTEL